MLPGEDFAMAGGDSQMFTDLPDGITTTSINFLLPNGTRVYVSESHTMENDKVYRITLNGSAAQGYTTAVTVQDASVYFN
jgi:hypothetical protein